MNDKERAIEQHRLLLEIAKRILKIEQILENKNEGKESQTDKKVPIAKPKR